MATIVVEGEYKSYHRAERATLSIYGSFVHPDRAQGYEEAKRVHAAILERVTEYKSDGDATWSHADPVSTYTTYETPAEDEGDGGKRKVHISTVRILVKLSNLDIVSEVVEKFSRHGLTVNVSWSLTEKKRREKEREARVEAVSSARERADEYAAAIDRKVVEVLTISDVDDRGVGYMSKRSGAVGGAHTAPEISIPDITIHERVTVTLRTD